eukprot:15364565-Ditylum_brightwellii.AAC.1
MAEMVADQVVAQHQSVTSTVSPLNRKKGKCGACAIVGRDNRFGVGAAELLFFCTEVGWGYIGGMR